MRRTLAFGLMWRLIKLYSHIIICVALIGLCYMVILRGVGSPRIREPRPLNMDSELQSIELEVQKNRMELAALKQNLNEVEKRNGVRTVTESALDSSTMICVKKPPTVAKTDYNLWQVIQDVEFTNEDGGAWKQGWNIEYDATQWHEKNLLKVFVVPHSHNDPGWIKTFDQYYTEQTRNILTIAVSKLMEFPDMRFIWAEVSFFARWYDDQPQVQRDKVAKLINDGRLEFVTGGWVMNDEANTHYYAMIEQHVLGHKWIETHFPKAPKPRNGWAIDPFGLSPTMAFLLKEFGLKNMVIQRLHYFLKKHLASSKALEFHWRQPWDNVGNTDMFCHAMPFYSYDVPHTCGPDPAVCCQFDFARMGSSRMSCPWKQPPMKIDKNNVAARSQILLDQYRRKAQLYQTNSILIPLGDDFRYDRAAEWNAQYTNYRAIMDYVNNNTKLNARIHFATLEDYFRSVEEDLRTSAVTIPSLSGDFFTYADKNDEYWSGFYTSRPFYKFLDRRAESILRIAEITSSLARANGMKCKIDAELDAARRGLSLFQHHDGITGTAKTHVMRDYGAKLNRAISDSMKIIHLSTESLLGNPNSCDSDFVINLNGTTEGYSSRVVLDFKKSSYDVAVVNTLTSYRREIVSIYTVSPDITVKGAVSQLSPVFDDCRIRDDLYELSFEVELRPLEIKSFVVTRGGQETAPLRASIDFYKIGSCSNSGGGVFQVSSSDEKNMKIQTSGITATFSAYTGLLTRLTQNAAQASTEISFWKYSTPQGSGNTNRDRSGAYLFMPEKDAPTGIRFNPSTVVVIQGSLLSEVISITPDITTHFRIKESPGIDGQSIEIHNIVDLSRNTNFELMMKVSTLIDSSSIFTDLNGFSYVERKYQHRLPVQANVYPMSSMLYLQDSQTRLSLASAQPLGVTDRGEKGTFYVFLDRRLNQDDNRGLGQTVTDNVPALSSFRLSIESQEEEDPRPSLLSLLSYHALTSPLLPLVVNGIGKDSYSSSSTLQPCGLHLVNVRTLESSSDEPRFLVTLHNEGYSCSEVVPTEVCQITDAGMDLTTLFGRVFDENAQFTSLSDLHPGEDFHITENIHVPTNHIKAVKLSRMFT
ncbi:alpha-mannosidase 2x [Galendromus occidentalis]|uniref:Alpha-mannosidase n=1 Tax=Galendromus occidentalis TaxID=34638 RepID=A0AAJ6QZ12_9ACAR|nr:alpha-mannosidase 2x [Galendromus occidentalis]